MLARLASGAAMVAVVLAGSLGLGNDPARADDAGGPSGPTTPDPTATVQSFSPSEFANEAKTLPSELTSALSRDLGMSGEEYLAKAAAAKNASDVSDALTNQGVDVLDTQLSDDGAVIIAVKSADDVAAVQATGASAQVGATATPDRSKLPTATARVSGGHYYETPNASCSTGFNGYAADGSSLVASAGHCWTASDGSDSLYWGDFTAPIAFSGQFVLGSGGELGTWKPGSAQFGGGKDASLISTSITAEPTVSNWGGRAGASATSAVDVVGTVSPVVGAPVCKSGARTGWTCGTIFETHTTVNVREGTSIEQVVSFLDDSCGASGDSGGAVMTGNYAVGLVSSGISFFSDINNETPDACSMDVQVARFWAQAQTDPVYSAADLAEIRQILDTDPKQILHSGEFAISDASDSAKQMYGHDFQVAVAVSQPQLNSTTVVSGFGKVSGTLPYGSTDHVVILTVNGHEYTAPVAADGSFTVTAADLSAGTYSYSMIAAYGAGQFSKSSPVSGSLDVVDVRPVVINPIPPVVAGTSPTVVTGTVDPSAVAATVSAGGVSVNATLGTGGVFTASFPGLAPGVWAVVVTQESYGGYTASSTASATVTIGAPVPPLAAASSAAVGTLLSGSGYPGATVTVRFTDNVQASAVVGGNGEWTVTIPDIEPGTYQLTVWQSLNGQTSDVVQAGVLTIVASADAVSTQSPVASPGATTLPATQVLSDTGFSGGALVVGAGAVLLIGVVALVLAAVARRRSSKDGERRSATDGD